MLAGALNLAIKEVKSEELALVRWALPVVAVMVLLSSYVNVHRHWLTYAITGSSLQIRHRLYGKKEINLAQIVDARLKETQGGRNYRYNSIELSLGGGKTVMLDGLYNRDIERFCESLQTRLL